MDVRVPTPDGGIVGYQAEPQTEVSGPEPYPGVVVVHDAFGITMDARNITDRFATAGYLALAPDLYSRGGRIRCIRTVFRELLAGRGRAFDDLDAARRALAGRPDCSGRVGVVGFCMGGGFALVAAAGPGRGGPTTGDTGEKGRFAAAAPYYGQLPADLSVLDGACPIVASFGRRDPTLRGAAGKLTTKLTEQGIPHDVMEYPDAGHSFANQLPLGPLNQVAKFAGFGYDHEASEHAWRRVQAFFAEHLG